MNQTVSILCALTILVLSTAAGAAPFTAMPLGHLGGGDETTIPKAMNAPGTIGGRSQTAGSLERAVMWTKAGGLVDIGAGGQASGILDLNNPGTAIGYRQNVDLSMDYWTYDGTFHDLVLPHDHDSTLRIADNGDIMYRVDTDPQPTVKRQTYYYDGVTATNIGHLGGGRTEGRDMDNSGTIVGRSRTAQPRWHAIIWTAANDIREIAGGLESSAIAISDSGQVLGYIDDDDGHTLAAASDGAGDRRAE